MTRKACAIFFLNFLPSLLRGAVCQTCQLWTLDVTWMFNKTTWSFADTLVIVIRVSSPMAFSFLPLVCFSGCYVTGQLAFRGTWFLGASHYQPNHTQREGIAQRDRLRGQWQPFLSTQPHVLCQEVIQLAASTPSFLSKPTRRQRLWSRGALVHRAEFSIYGFFYPSHQTQEWLVAVMPIWQNK